MCGIFGIVSRSPSIERVFTGLSKLEYRGYDSAGIATLHDGAIQLVKEKGKLAQLMPMLNQLPQNAQIAMGHNAVGNTRVPHARNAHPHAVPSVAIIHNGIIENYKDLRSGLLAGGVQLVSKTDTEVVLHLLADELENTADIKEALVKLAHKLRGCLFTRRDDCSGSGRDVCCETRVAPRHRIRLKARITFQAT